MKKLSRVTLNVFDYIGTAMQTGKAYWVSTRRSRSGVEGVLGASVRRGSIGSPLARGELKVGVRPREKPLVGARVVGHRIGGQAGGPAPAVVRPSSPLPRGCRGRKSALASAGSARIWSDAAGPSRLDLQTSELRIVVVAG